MDNSIIYNNIKNYLIDKNINTNDEDNTFINKLKYSLLKYKRIIAIILLIILLFIGYQCNISFLDTNTNSYNLKGGEQSVIAGKLSSAMNSLGTTLKSGKIYALKSGASETYDFGARRADDFKDFAPRFYTLIYSIALSVLMFLIFMPAVGFFVVGIICYSMLKDKMGYIKSL